MTLYRICTGGKRPRRFWAWCAGLVDAVQIARRHSAGEPIHVSPASEIES